MALAVMAVLGVSACSGGSTQATPGDLGDAKELIAYDWKVGPGVETYFCVYQTLKEDVWISGFSPVEPTGTHHVVVGFDDPGPPDGVIPSTDPNAQPPCTGVSLSRNMVYFGGVGAGNLPMPAGVAVKIPAGKQLFLGLHLFNTGTADLTGRSGMSIVRANPATVEHEAETIAAGTISLAVPPGKSTQTGQCTMVDDVTVFALAPHMHLTGTHNTTTLLAQDGTSKTIFDQDYSFTEQPYVVLGAPLSLHKNDVLQVACDYANPSNKTLLFGESTTNEMCFTFVYRYPAVATSPFCPH